MTIAVDEDDHSGSFLNRHSAFVIAGVSLSNHPNSGPAAANVRRIARVIDRPAGHARERTLEHEALLRIQLPNVV